jgi:hypothetical protein
LTRLYIADTKAIHHIFMNNYDYQKSNATRYDLSRMVGSGAHSLVPLVFVTVAHSVFLTPGLLVVEEDEHKQQVSSSCNDSCDASD